MKKITIIIGIIILLVIVLVLVKKPGIVSGPQNTFIHSSESFSFKYPTNLKINEQTGYVVLSEDKEEGGKDVSNIGLMNFPDYLNTAKTQGITIEEKTLGKNKVYILSSEEYPDFGIQYLIPLEEGENASNFLGGGVIPNTVGFTQKEFENIFSTISIDKEKMDAYVQTLIAEAQVSQLDTQLKATLLNIRPAAELYYDIGKSYIGLCSPKGTTDIEKMIKEGFDGLRTAVGENALVCEANKTSYAVSIMTPKSEFYCVDAKGFSGTTTELVRGKFACE